MSESPEPGKRRQADRDQEADQGERVDEYRRGDWVKPGDPANHARAKAADENATRPGDSPPRMSPNNEAWQREKQISARPPTSADSRILGVSRASSLAANTAARTRREWVIA